MASSTRSFAARLPEPEKAIAAGAPVELGAPVQKVECMHPAASFAVDQGALAHPQGPITVGSTWHFQFWYRDPGGPGFSGFNFSDGLRISFCE